MSYPLGSNGRVMKTKTRPSATINRSLVGKLNALSSRIRADEHQRRLNIIIGAASPLERWGLRSMLGAEKDFHIIGEAGNGHEALGMVREEEPDVVMFDVMMPHLHGIEIARRISEERLVSRTVVLSNFTDRPIVEAAVNAGVHGFVHKPGVETELRSAVRKVGNGGTYFSPPADRARRLLADYGDRTKRPSGLVPCLTQREVEVLQLIAEGHANKMIADILKISVKTVEKHRQSCMNRLSIHDTASLTRYAIQIGMIDCRQQKVMAAILAA
jgi:DNA-binding NarL/FixJ family response regulator